MKADRWRGAGALAALRWVALIMLVLGFGGGCEPSTPALDTCEGGCAPGALLLENGCCQPAGLPPDMTCPPGEWPNDNGECQPAGLPLDMPCPPGERLRDDGGCQPAGVPPEDCGDGFAPDGNGGCDAILPAEDCQKGQMAIPGETVCHDVATCGADAYGDIPVDPATTQFVNQAYVGADSNGSEAKPWKTIQEGIDAAVAGAIVAVAAGTYSEDAIIEDRPVVLWGRCPALVEVAGTGAELAAVQILGGNAATSEVRGLAVSGAFVGVAVVGASDVVVDRAWIHETGDIGISITDELGPTSARVTASLIEATHTIGVNIIASDVKLAGIVVRDVRVAGGESANGIEVQADVYTNTRASVQITASVIERAHDVGVYVSGSNAELSGVVVRDILSGGTGEGGIGIAVEDNAQINERSEMLVTASVVERANGVGVFISGSNAELSGVVVRDIQGNGGGLGGRGITVQSDLMTQERSQVHVAASVVERTNFIGMLVAGADMELSGVVVRDIQTDGSAGSGQGIAVQSAPQANERASLQVTASVVERTHEAGISVLGADAELSGVVVRDILPDVAGKFGGGIYVQDDDETNERASLQVTASVVERTHTTGVLVGGSVAELVGVVVRDILPDDAGNFGAGVVVHDGFKTNERASVQIIASVVERAHEVGVVVSGSDADLMGVVVRDVLPSGAGLGGTGISIQKAMKADERADVQIIASVVERAHQSGVAVWGSDAKLVAVVVRDIASDGSGRLGTGIQVQRDPSTNALGTLHILASIVERTHEAGVLVYNADATIEGLIVRNTSANGEGQFGDGIVVWAHHDPAQATITGSVLDSNARAGLASWGAPTRFTSTVLSCNGFDLQGEVYNDIPFSFPDSQNNFCGCPAVADICNALSTGLAPPPRDDLPIPSPDPVP